MSSSFVKTFSDASKKYGKFTLKQNDFFTEHLNPGIISAQIFKQVLKFKKEKGKELWEISSEVRRVHI